MLTLSQRFKVLDQLLSQAQWLWRIDPFELSLKQTLPWQAQLPELSQFLEQLTGDQVFAFKQDTSGLIQALQPFVNELSLLWEMCDLPSCNNEKKSHKVGIHKRAVYKELNSLNTGIPGRKWQQISAMGAAVLEKDTNQASQWLEWCSGKGYLGQFLAHQSNIPVVSFEWQQRLCDAGQALADKHKLSMTFVQGDALSSSCHSIFNPNQHAVALHACGDLHARLIEHSCHHLLSAVSISPCCYHLIEGKQYQALSTLGKQSKLKLTKNELKIPLQETVTGGERVKLHRELEMVYRLGLDSLLREKMTDESYTPLPSIKKSLLNLGFVHFCQWAEQQKPLNVATKNLSEQDLNLWLARGRQRFLQMERISLVQQVFRRPLEMWLVCDKALRLEQHGYQVLVGTFCTRQITPRNILIQATI